jgi:hypothetical protein
MNEEELQLMVERARDAEGSPSQPPPGLVDTARTAGRRRRRLVTLGGGALVAAAIVAAVAVPSLVDGGDDAPLPTVGQDELADHGGPCPSLLPTPTDDRGYGFGTDERAKSDPLFMTPESAWVCEYLRQDDIWKLQQTPRRLDDALLGSVGEALDGLAPGSGPEACTDDLGPRWMLVTSTGGDLTGAVVDDYGCRSVRLTNDPFVTAPGDPQEGGTVAGILTSTDGFVDTLRAWWDSSPADDESSPTPAELRVTCTDDGPQVESTAVAATSAGVVVVVDSTMSKGSYLTYSSEGISGGDALGQIPNPATYRFPPGRLTIDCASPPGMDEIAPVDIEVVDPNGYWRTSTLADYGCTSSSSADWIALQGGGPTAEVAVEDLLDDFASALDLPRADYVAEQAPTGYSGAATQTWVAYRRGKAAFSIDVTLAGSSYSAHPNVRCDDRR